MENGKPSKNGYDRKVFESAGNLTFAFIRYLYSSLLLEN